MSQDSLLINDEQGHRPSPSATGTWSRASKSHSNGSRALSLREHMKLVKQKREEADVNRLQRFQEQLRKKEEKWQQQQSERVDKWSQLRHRDTDRRVQVEERRRKLEDDAKVKLSELLRREKQRTTSQTASYRRVPATSKSESLTNTFTHVQSTRRTLSKSRSTQQDMTHQRQSNDSPMTSASSHAATSSRQLASNQPSHDATLTPDESSLSGASHSAARSRPRTAMPSSYTYWLNTGDNNNNNPNASFMRSTYAATCRSRLSRSVERCPRACRGREESAAHTPVAATTNDEPRRRTQSINRQHLNETICRLSKPKTISMTQSVHVGSLSQFSQSLRAPTPPVTTPASPSRRSTTNRPITAPTIASTSRNDARTSPLGDAPAASHRASSSTRQSVHRLAAHPKPPLSSSSRRPKPPVSRSLMTASHSSSSLSSSASANKPSRRPISSAPVPKPKARARPTSSNSPTTDKPGDDANFSAHGDSSEEDDAQTPAENQSSASSVDLITSDASSDVAPPAATPAVKQEGPSVDEQEYQRKLAKKIREAQQRMEMERQREEERQRQLEFEENEREQEQIRLVEEQALVEQERLQRAIEECDRENELKRQEEQRLQQQRDEAEKRQAEEAERLQRERQEKARKEEEERIERKKRLDLIMKRTRHVSPNSKQPPDNTTNGADAHEATDHDPPHSSSILHSISDNRLPTLSSTPEHIHSKLDSSSADTPKYKSPLIQNLLNRARDTRSVDNLSQSNMTDSQLISESMLDETTNITQTTIATDPSVDSDNVPARPSTNGHGDVHSPPSLMQTRPMETAMTFD